METNLAMRDYLAQLAYCGITVFMGAVFATPHPVSAADSGLIFVSSFTGGDGGGIHAYRLNHETGRLQPAHHTTGISNVFFLALSRDQRFLYANHSEQFGGEAAEEAVAYELVGRTGELKMLNRQVTHGKAPCYLELDATGRTLLVANFVTGNVLSLPVQADGSLREAQSIVQHVGTGVDQERQQGPHAHCFVVSPDNRFAYAADLGLDQILGYQLDPATATITANRQPFVRTIPVAGPRHLTFHPNGKWMYVINELKNSATRFDYDSATGMLIERQTISTLPEDFKDDSFCADLKITPDGRFLYGTNRGHHSIAAYAIGAEGDLTLIEIVPSLGAGPQNLLITPSGGHLLCANMPGNNLAIFKIDGQSGRLTSTGTPQSVPSPSCIMQVR